MEPGDFPLVILPGVTALVALSRDSHAELLFSVVETGVIIWIGMPYYITA